MVRPKQEEIDAQLKRQELDSDGSESASGSNPVPGEDITADVDAMVEEVIGNKPEEEVDGFNIGDAVNEDEHKIQHGDEINDYEEDDEDSDDLKIERKENVTEDPKGDPYDTFGEDDDLDDASEE
jgi:hypothetical protein